MISLIFTVLALAGVGDSQSVDRVGAASDERALMIREDRVWEFVSPVNGIQYLFKFDGTEDVNGTSWHRMVNFSNKGWGFYYMDVTELNADLRLDTMLLREENGKVYLLIPQSDSVMSDTEVLLYDFNLAEGDSFNSWHPFLYDHWMPAGVPTTGTSTIVKREEVLIDGNISNKFTTCFRLDSDDDKDLEYNFSYVEGVGNTGLGLPYALPYSRRVGVSNEDPYFSRFLDLDGNVVYRNVDVDSPDPPLLEFAESYKPLLKSDRTWVYQCDVNGVEKWLYARFREVAPDIMSFEIVGESDVMSDVSPEKCVINRYDESLKVARMSESPEKREVYILDDEGNPSLLYSFAVETGGNLICRVDGQLVNKGPSVNVDWLLCDGYEIARRYRTEIEGEELEIIEGVGNTGPGGMTGPLTRSGLEDSPEKANLYRTNLQFVFDDEWKLLWKADHNISQGIQNVGDPDCLEIIAGDGFVEVYDESEEGPLTLTLYDIAGRRVAACSGTNRIRISVEELVGGVYVARAETENGMSVARRFVVR